MSRPGGKFAPENPERDKEVIEALARGRPERAGGKWIESQSAEGVRRLQDAASDRRTLEMLGKLKPPKPDGETKEVPSQKREPEETDWGFDSMYEGLQHEVYAEEGGDLYATVRRGTITEIFYRILAEKYPNLGVIIDEGPLDGADQPVSVKYLPHKISNKKLSNLAKNAVRVVLSMDGPYEQETVLRGQELERQGILPAGITQKALVRKLTDEVRKLSKLPPSALKRWVPSYLEYYKGKLEGLKNVEPLSDEEARPLLEKAIREDLARLDK